MIRRKQPFLPVMVPFGLTNAPATFERLMECVLAGLTYEECLI